MNIEYVGPFEVTHVVINGRQVPYLGAEKDAEGVIRFINLPGYCLELPPPNPDRPYESENIIRFVAEAIATGMGYCGIPDDGSHPVKRPDFPPVHLVTFGGPDP